MARAADSVSRVAIAGQDELTAMVEDRDKDRVIEIAKAYAEEECVGEHGEVLDAHKEAGNWIVDFRTHIFPDAYDHRVKITAVVGNVISNERTDRLE